MHPLSPGLVRIRSFADVSGGVACWVGLGRVGAGTFGGWSGSLAPWRMVADEYGAAREDPG